MRSTPASRGAGAVALAATVALAGTPAWALSVTVNGQPVTFNPAPISRAGRVFVPLRGVFDRLGASVVYAGGVINATGNGHAISLRIGSTAATIDGQARGVDVAPFVIGASTYVPLRFVSQALGAGVNYDAANQIVALQTGTSSGNAAPPPAANAPAPAASVVTGVLKDLQPARAGFVESTKPTVSANFDQPVDANSVRVTLDGRDVTSASTLSTTGFVYAPSSPLQSIRHTVVTTGKLASGQPFTSQWAFTTGSAAPANTLTISSPADGGAVPSSFTVKGHTLPNARIHIVGGATASLGGVFAFGAGNYSGDTTADADGNFSQDISLQTVSGATIGLTITSTDPTTKEAAEKKLRLRAQ